ncbi:phage tail protein [Rhodobacter ferrooxidans]|uniref:von Willebrand factor type A n=1 Tax=Rhodobacter ferrooxidans TaxID=371731 RepID=C8S4Q8_9RHOB|nr:phage tail protein [Rhodobacter sp. SW2]EEW24057.1 von Willebrand factor type A [Rhodobacter sp. SW2]
MGSAKSQTVGYRYSLGVHLALCHGPVDAIREIRVDDRTAWSIGTAQSSSAAGSGAGAQASYGSLTGVSAEAGTGGASVATLRFAGMLPGIRLGASYDLRLASDGSRRTVTLQAVSHAKSTGITTWLVEPASTAFAAQSATVTEAASLPSLSQGAAGGRIRINAPELFGGETREGGIVGDIDVLMGEPAQGQNDYLAARARSDVPGYRGLCSLVLRQVYMGLNPYLKPWSVRLTRVLQAADGAPQWYPAKAQIVPEARIDDAAVYIAMDASGSMSGSRMAAQIAAVARLIREISANAAPDAGAGPNDLQIVTYNAAVTGTVLRRNADAAAYGELTAWVEALSPLTEGGTDYGAALSLASAFFSGAAAKHRILIFVTDGAPSPAATLQTAKATLAAITGVDVFAFNIALADTSATAELDNTPVDGVPVVPPDDPEALVASLRAGFGRGPDMNPAHIIRECLTNADWGLGHAAADIGPSFTAAADALFAEGFGLSLLWQQDGTIEEFIADVLKHIDAHLFVDRRSGRWELRLIRADYDAATLPVFDDSSVVDWGELGRRETADLVNSVTVKFSDIRTDQTGSVSVTDTALVQQLGQVISATVDYPGIRFEALAVRAAERDLRGLSAPLLTGEITVSRIGAGLEPGDVIRLFNPRRGLDGLVVRIAEISHGDGRNNGIRIKIAEDVFALGRTAIVGGESGASTALILPPRPLTRRWVEEAPYWLLVQEQGHAQADALLAEDPGCGAIIAAGERPSPDALSVQVWADSGAGFGLEQAVAFVPAAHLTAAISDDPAEDTISVGGWSGLGDVAIGTLASLGPELVRIDGVSATSLTIGRGCLDTVPMSHAAGTALLCWQQLGNASEPRFAASEAVAVKMLPETGFGTLPLAQAPADQITLASRAIRPLPPGNLRANGTSTVNPNLLNLGPVLLTWAHRDRLLQTSSVFDAYDAGDIGPEPGVSYVLELRWVDPVSGAVLEPVVARLLAGSANSFTLGKDAIPLATAPPGTRHFELRLQAERSTGSVTYQPWTARAIRLFVPDGIKIAEAGLWAEFGAGAATISAARAELWISRGASAGAMSAAAISCGRADLFIERGGASRPTSSQVSIYIEVLP